MSANPPVGVQLSRMRGWRMPINCVKVDRSSKLFGNLFRVGIHGNAAQCVEKFEACLRAAIDDEWSALPASLRVEAANLIHQWIDVRAYFKSMAKNLQALRGKSLGCWCPRDAPCHRNVLLCYANRAEA
jgi:hypothetical protein